MATGNLTPKQEAFVQAIVRGANQTEAYGQAGYSLQQAPETIWSHASALANDDKVLARIHELKAAVAVNRGWNLDKLIQRSEINLDGAQLDRNWSAADKVINTIGKATGLLVEKVEHSGTVKHAFLAVSDEQLRAWAQVALEPGAVEAQGRIVPETEGE